MLTSLSPFADLSAVYVSAVVQYLVDQEILEAVRNMQLASIPDIWQQFWSGSLDSSEYVSFLLLSEESVRNFSLKTLYCDPTVSFAKCS